uniref:Uncharacterized protein n=1 Tax=Chromera velia CCMP2878 TaxID=1169474 RepID=A0A0G4GLG6_9ALVE|eukprot:Cvel_22423.t1-p1 / transcript=Cvel_22423.t1 / gene=Cvel_22423 / organism=Chromera_velia_CCMP2878 / gene_product=hypothetical protein / transcript_product=hypothetical protein / location=Cvel_scaffold2201:3685-5967(+) / protein_length=194 / sequence_SO=supercontig / SO=protein_coding / is_pseudo=false
MVSPILSASSVASFRQHSGDLSPASLLPQQTKESSISPPPPIQSRRLQHSVRRAVASPFIHSCGGSHRRASVSPSVSINDAHTVGDQQHRSSPPSSLSFNAAPPRRATVSSSSISSQTKESGSLSLYSVLSQQTEESGSLSLLPVLSVQTEESSSLSLLPVLSQMAEESGILSLLPVLSQQTEESGVLHSVLSQ